MHPPQQFDAPHDDFSQRRAVNECLIFDLFDFIMADDFNDILMVLERPRRNDFGVYEDMSCIVVSQAKLWLSLRQLRR